MRTPAKQEHKKPAVTKLMPLATRIDPCIGSNIAFRTMQAYITHYTTLALAEVRITIHHEKQQQLDALLAGEVDLCFSGEHKNDKRITQKKIFILSFYLMASDQYALLHKENISSKIFTEETLINGTVDCDAKHNFDRYLQLSSYVSVKEAVLANLGLGILPSNLVEGDKRIIKIDKNPVVTLPIYLTFRANYRSELMQAFTKFLFTQK